MPENVKPPAKRSCYRELLKLNYRIALSNDNKRLSEILKCAPNNGRFLYMVRKGIENE